MPASLYPQVMTTKTKLGHTEDDLLHVSWTRVLGSKGVTVLNHLG
jgi:hypothetical protein